MKFLRFHSFVFLLMLIFHHARCSNIIAKAYQENKGVFADKGIQHYSTGVAEKEIIHENDFPAIEVRRKRFGGRKMVIRVECKFKTKKSSFQPFEVQMAAGYVPFNADYHVPRPHPPKNN